MSSALTKRLEFTESGYIHSVKDVVSALNYYFFEAKKKDAQLAGKILFTATSSFIIQLMKIQSSEQMNHSRRWMESQSATNYVSTKIMVFSGECARVGVYHAWMIFTMERLNGVTSTLFKIVSPWLTHQ